MFSASKTAGPSGYNLTNSLRFRSSASAFLNRTPSVAGNRQIWTWSGWVKRGTLGDETPLFQGFNSGADRLFLGIDTQNTIQVYGSAGAVVVATSAVFRDPSAWYHIVFAFDTTQATASNRVKIYVNGIQQAISTGIYPSLNAQWNINNTVAHQIGSSNNGVAYFDGYMDEINFIDGQALTPSSFGSTNSTTGVWQPARYSGTYGTNGFYLNFTDIGLTSGSNTGLGRDFSGNGNYWTTNNISVTAGVTYDAMSDVPTLTSATVANYCVASPIDKGSSLTLSQANLSGSIGTTWNIARGTIGNTSGKWYYEFQFSGTSALIGICGLVTNLATNLGVSASDYGYQSSGFKWNNNSNPAYGATWTTGDIIGVAYDLDVGTIEFYKNGTSQGVAYSGIPAGTYFPAVSIYNSTLWTNFGQRPFSYTPPSGFNRLNTFNLPNSTIVKGNTVMDATLYTGTGANLTISTNNIDLSTNGLLWIKSRSTAEDHLLLDSLRTYFGTKYWQAFFSNSTAAEAGYGGSDNVVPGSYRNIAGGAVGNVNGTTYVQWLWQAGSAAASSNTAGSITSTVSANPTAGFSIVTYTGTGSAASIGHGLGVTPEFIMVKRRNVASNWMVVSKYLTNYNWYLKLNLTDAQVGDATIGNIDPSSTTFNVGTNAIDNASGGTYVAYVWAPIAGFSKFGSYTGNGSTDGPFVYTGFRPTFIMCKRSDGVSNWNMADNKRPTYNPEDEILLANSSLAALTSYPVDFLSNGFKIRTTEGGYNTSSGTYIFMAFAENPFKNALAR
jgi:hypothetical protein